MEEFTEMGFPEGHLIRQEDLHAHLMDHDLMLQGDQIPQDRKETHQDLRDLRDLKVVLDHLGHLQDLMQDLQDLVADLVLVLHVLAQDHLPLEEVVLLDQVGREVDLQEVVEEVKNS